MKTLLKQGIFLSVIAMMLTLNVSAQSYLKDPKYGVDEETRKECAANLSLYREQYNHRNYEMAKPYWKKVLNKILFKRSKKEKIGDRSVEIEEEKTIVEDLEMTAEEKELDLTESNNTGKDKEKNIDKKNLTPEEINALIFGSKKK